jgi:hypothetical protein
MADQSSTLGRPSCGVYPSEKEAEAPPLPSSVCLVVVCSSQLAAAIATQPGTGYIVVAQWTPRIGSDRGLALGTLAVAGRGGSLAGAVPPASVARWVLVAVARASRSSGGLSVSDAAWRQVYVR